MLPLAQKHPSSFPSAPCLPDTWELQVIYLELSTDKTVIIKAPFACKGKCCFKVQKQFCESMEMLIPGFRRKLQMLWESGLSLFKKGLFPKFACLFLYTRLLPSEQRWSIGRHFPALATVGLKIFLKEASSINNSKQSNRPPPWFPINKEQKEVDGKTHHHYPKKILEGRFWKSDLSVFHFAPIRQWNLKEFACCGEIPEWKLIHACKSYATLRVKQELAIDSLQPLEWCPGTEDDLQKQKGQVTG